MDRIALVEVAREQRAILWRGGHHLRGGAGQGATVGRARSVTPATPAGTADAVARSQAARVDPTAASTLVTSALRSHAALHKRKRLVKPAYLDRFVDRSGGRDERVSWNPSRWARLWSTTSRCSPVESMKDRPRRWKTPRCAALSMPFSVACSRLAVGNVKLAEGPHERDVIAPLHFGDERLKATYLKRPARSGATPVLGCRATRSPCHQLPRAGPGHVRAPKSSSIPLPTWPTWRTLMTL